MGVNECALHLLDQLLRAGHPFWHFHGALWGKVRQTSRRTGSTPRRWLFPQDLPHVCHR